VEHGRNGGFPASWAMNSYLHGQNMITQFISIARDVSAVVALWVAIYGIDSWRREHRGKRQVELAEDVLALFYEARDAIMYMRHPFVRSSEVEDIKQTEDESEQQWEARKNASVVFKRYNDRQELFSRIHSLRYRFMAQIGHREAEPFDELRKIVNEILFAARSLARLWPKNYFSTDQQREEHYARIEKYEAVFWEGLESEDQISKRLAKTVVDMERYCRDVIEGKGTIHYWVNRRLGKRR
jgi:argonaute-like protein implicated in RNA metabolism and viral defense